MFINNYIDFAPLSYEVAKSGFAPLFFNKFMKVDLDRININNIIASIRARARASTSA